MVDKSLEDYIINNILPRYNSFDKGHNLEHVNNVIKESLGIASEYELNMNMVYTIAAYHDCGLNLGRELHHINSAKALKTDENLIKWFNSEEILVMAEAIEDHRASAKTEPRSIYGKIVADADREFTPERLIFRTISFGKKHYPELDREEHIARCYEHCVNKYGPNGYMKFYLKSKRNQQEIERLYSLLENIEEFSKECEKYL